MFVRARLLGDRSKHHDPHPFDHCHSCGVEPFNPHWCASSPRFGGGYSHFEGHMMDHYGDRMVDRHDDHMMDRHDYRGYRADRYDYRRDYRW